ncbi:rhamnan synthesis F family protein [Mesorhizobium sp. SARCC-RB16n]|uniref:rhamnan synthesis F family protein n=1 Tax=Mesorhizobium sp. SARCC-RB16n TaxID=2116687 RepID=UPI001665373C|nr:rhamnan synthesis F family protein [Mesorhizobium sp. SARCC-RB16n]
MNRAEAEALAGSLRSSALFDGAGYGRLLPAGMDPVLHYVVAGERMGWRPSAGFDPYYYLERYGDIAAAGISPLWHYEHNGRDERRQPVSLADGLIYPQLATEGAPVVLVLSHEASRTGAPVLGWNLIRHLSDRYRVVSLVLRGGELERDFEAAAAVSIGPLAEYCHSADASRIAERIAEVYAPLYAVANSVETRVIVPHLVAMGVPTVALVHEFAAYVRPVDSMRQVYDFASHVVFPARVVAESSARFFSDMKVRAGVHVKSQGRNDPPRSREISNGSYSAEGKALGGPLDEVEGRFVVIGAGFVQIRKGVDLFIAVAAAARRLRPDLRFRFIWIGEGYDPVNDQDYSSYLAEQLVHSDLGDSLVMTPAVADLEPFYARADAFLMSSRLDPQPNVGIDAVTRGIPTICFEGACGTAEILSADADTRHLVVPHLDTHAAAEEICRLAAGGTDIGRLRATVARVGREAYDMKGYVGYLDALGLDAAESMNREDLETLVSSKAVDPAMLLPMDSDVLPEFELERMALLRWSLWGGLEGTTANPLFRRPCAGFHPQVYAKAHEQDCLAGRRSPLAHWVRNGRQRGPWSRTVFSPDNVPRAATTQRIALHGHFHYPELAANLCSRLLRNSTLVDLFLSTDSHEKAEQLRRTFRQYHGSVSVAVFPNRGRDIGAFLTGFAREIVDGAYDVFGHVHGKRSLAAGASLGDTWRNFLWENLVGGEYAMLDLAAAAFAATSELGLLMAEDPHLLAWGANRDIAQGFAGRIGISTPLDDFFDFPIGNMFWARPAALHPLLTLGLDWSDWPTEPADYDGTIMHALERLLPFAARHAGLEVAGMRAPGTSW